MGAIDAGSNAIRFEVAEFTSPSEYRIISKTRMPIRLGHLVFTTGGLDERTIAQASRAFRLFAAGLKQLGTVAYRAVATSATREASNGDAFVRRVFEESGIRLEPISGEEEAGYVHIAVKSRVDLSEGRWILADLGGGSVEVSLVDDTGILWSQSYPVGTVRLLETLERSAGNHKSVTDWVSQTLRHLTIPPPQSYPGSTSFAATGGNIETIASLALSYVDPLSVSVIPIERMESVIQLVGGMTVKERIKHLSLRPDRADVILPAVLAYHHFANICGAQEIVVPNVGVKDGVLLSLASRWQQGTLASGP